MVIKEPVTQYYHREEKPKQLSVALVPAARVAELQQERPAAACSPCSAPASLRRWTSSPSRERYEKQNPVSSRLRLFFFLWHHKVPSTKSLLPLHPTGSFTSRMACTDGVLQVPALASGQLLLSMCCLPLNDLKYCLSPKYGSA